MRTNLDMIDIDVCYIDLGRGSNVPMWCHIERLRAVMVCDGQNSL